MKWLSAFLSALIVGVFAGFYVWTYSGHKSYLKDRDARLVASAAGSLRAAVQADEPDSRVTRQQARLRVSGLAKQGGDYSVRLAQVLDGVALPEAFAALLVADAAGDVIEQHARARLEGLRRLGDAPAGDDKATAAQKAERAAFALRPTLQPLQLGETRLLAFCHPAPLPPAPDKPTAKPESKQGPSKDKPAPPAKTPPASRPADAAQAPSPAAAAATPEGETLVVCGLVDEAGLEREAGAVSPLALACLLAVFGLSLLAPPFLKVQLLARSQRLRFADVFTVAVCQFLGLMILAEVVFGIAVYYGLAGLADAELRGIAVEVRRHLGAELRAIDDQLTRSDADAQPFKAAWSDADRKAAAEKRTADSPAPERLRLSNDGLLSRGLCPPPSSTATVDGRGCMDWPVQGEKKQPYPFFETLAWIAPDGEQRVKWWTGAGQPVAQGFFDVTRRSYFTDARDGFLTVGGHGSEWPACVMTSLRAWSNGAVRAVYARPAPKPAAVMALTARLLSLDGPVLPAGTGFAVIDASGEVLFHSDARLSRTHNLFEETVGNPRLRAAVTARAADTLAARYWGRPHSLHVEPLGPLPWSLVTFREHEWLRAVGVEALSEALLLSLGFIVVLFLLPALLYIAVAGRQTPFPWPDPDLVWLYTHLSGTFLIIGALYLGGLARCHGVEALVLAATLPVAALLAAAVVLQGRARLRRFFGGSPSGALARGWRQLTMASAALLVAGASWFASTPLGLLLGAVTAALLALALVEGSERVGSDSTGWFSRRWLFWHRLASACFWLLFAVLPAVGFVKGATDRALDAHAARSLTVYAQRLEARERALHAQYPDTLHDAEGLRQRRRELGWDVYEGTLHGLDEQRLDAGGGCADAPDVPANWPWSWLETRLAAWKPYLAEHAVDLRHARVPRDAAGRPPARWGLCTSTAPRVVVSGGPPTFGQVVGAWPWLTLLLLAAAVALSVRWGESALFALRATVPSQRSVADVRRHTPAGARLALLLPSGFERRDLLDGDWYTPLVKAADASATPRPTKPGLVDLWSLDPAALTARLEALEAGLQHPTWALIVLVPASSLAAWLADKAPADTRARWIEALERFEAATVQAPFTDADEKGLRALVESWLGDEAVPRVREALEAELRAAHHVLALCQGRPGPAEAGAHEPRACLRRVEELARGYYLSLWEACDADERLTLAQIADEGFVNSQRLDSLESLLGKGLVRAQPRLRLMNESFEAFVRRREQAAPLAQAEAAPAAAGFGWTHLRLPLLTLAVATAAFIFVTERRLFESASGLSTLLAGTVIPLLGTVVKVMRGATIADAAGGGGGGGRANA